MDRVRSPSWRGYLIALASTVTWSTTAIFISYLTTRFRMPPLVLAFWRNLLVVGALLAAIAVTARPLLRLERRHLPFFALYGLALSVFNALWTVSVALNGAAVATVLCYSSPAITALVARLWGGERLGRLKIGALVLSIAGCVFVSGAYDPATWRVNPAGALIGLTAGAAFATYGLLGKAASRRGINPWTATLYTFIFGTLFLLFVQRPDTLMWLSRPLAKGAAGWHEAALGWGTLTLLAVGPTVGGYGLYTVSLAHLPVTTASLITTLEPVLTAGWAFCFLGERLTLPQFLGGGLVLAGVALVRLGERGGVGARR
jgi:drug/metabolite transporter (DMT)-like permease